MFLHMKVNMCMDTSEACVLCGTTELELSGPLETPDRVHQACRRHRSPGATSSQYEQTSQRRTEGHRNDVDFCLGFTVEKVK